MDLILIIHYSDESIDGKKTLWPIDPIRYGDTDMSTMAQIIAQAVFRHQAIT